MKRVRYGLYSLLFVLSLITSLIVPSGIANATSDYDGTVRMTQELTVKYAPFVSEDISTSYTSIIRDGCSSAYVDSFTTTVNAGGEYSITKAERGASELRPDDEFVFVTWSEDGSGSLAFQTEYSTYRSLYRVTGSSVTYKSAQIYMDNEGSVQVACADGGQSAYQSTNQPDVVAWDFTIWSSTFNVIYPSGYEGELIPTEPPSAKYAGMGDSYSSGEGNPSFEYGTDVSNENGCHRSPQAYPRLLQGELELGPTAFVACSGATTTNITGSGQWNEPPQIDALTDETEIVTLTIGGNDVGFADYARACNVACGPGTTAYNTIMGKINDPDFKDSLVATYEAILAARPNADLDLYVADYPYLAAEDATMCWGLDFSGAYEVQEALNEVIFDAVIEVGLNSSHIFMVQANYPGSPFEGGHLCNGGDSLFHGIVLYPDLEYSLHPDAGGQAAYADVFEEAIG